MNIKELRAQYPQYEDMDDATLADSFHKKFYSDLPKEDVFNTLGVSVPKWYDDDTSTIGKILGFGSDVPIGIAKGAIGTAKIPNQVAAYLTDKDTENVKPFPAFYTPLPGEMPPEVITPGNPAANNEISQSINRGAMKALDSMSALQDALSKGKSAYSKTVEQNPQIFTPAKDKTDILPFDVNAPSASQISELITNMLPQIGLPIGAGGKAEQLAANLTGKAAQLAKGAGYGLGNAAITAPDAYEQTYRDAYKYNVEQGKSAKEADELAKRAADISFNVMAPLSAVTGGVGGAVASETVGTPLKRFLESFIKSTPLQAVEEGSQPYIESKAIGKPVDPYDVASQAAMGALMAGQEGVTGMLHGHSNVASTDNVESQAEPSYTGTLNDLLNGVTPEAAQGITNLPAIVPQPAPNVGDIDTARDARKQALDSILNEFRDSNNAVDNIRQPALPALVQDYQAKNQAVADLQTQVPENERPIRLAEGSPSTTETVKTAFDSITKGDVRALNTDVVHDMIDNNFVRINEKGLPELTDFGNGLYTELEKLHPSVPVFSQSIQAPTAPPLVDKFREERLVALEREHDALPPESPLRQQIVAEMNNLVEGAPVVQESRAEGVMQTPESADEQASKFAIEEATPAEAQVLANQQAAKNNVVPFAAATKKNAAPSSLLDFIANSGGIKDTGGDLTAMDAQLYHKGKPFQKKLLNEKGLNPDDLAGAAYESGYFPELTERPTIRQFYDAISNELAGKKRYQEGNAPVQMPQDEGALANDYYNRAQELGIKTEGATFEDIKQQVDERASIEGGDDTRVIRSNDGDIPFSATRKPSSGSLLVQHNLSAANLIHADKMGGIAVPSVAITKGEHPLHNFGEITLVGDSELINPKGNTKNKVYGSDVYSPRYPTVKYDVNYKDINKLNDSLRHFIDKTAAREIEPYQIQDNGIKALERNDAVLASFLDGKGISPKYATKSDGAVDRYQTSANINDQISELKLDNQLEEYARGLLQKLNPKEHIFDGFTPSGKRRYLPHNLDVVVKLLTKQVRGGENFNYGVGSIRAEFSKQFKTLEDIKKHEDRLVDSETFEKIKKNVDDEFFKISEGWRPHSHRENSFSFLDDFSEHLKEAAKRGVPYINKEYYNGNVSKESMEETAGFLNKLRDFNTEYFEAKLQRPVAIGEFKGAVVPEGHQWDRAVEVLKKNGVTRIERYKNNDEKSRRDAVARFNDVFFKSEGDNVPTTKFAKSADQIKQDIQKIALRINPSVDINFANHLWGEGEALKASGASTASKQEVAGVFDRLRNLMEVSLDTTKFDPTNTAYHELWHSIEKMLTSADLQVLDSKYPGNDRFSALEQRAIAFADWAQRKNMSSIPAAVRRVFAKVMDFLKSVGRTLKLGKFNSVEDVFNRVESGKVYDESVNGQLKDAISSADIGALNDLITGGTQYKATGNKVSEAFKKWFGDSKVVDEKGDPLVVYHSTTTDFDTFRTNSEMGAHFGTKSQVDSFNPDENRRTLPVYLKIENPIRLVDSGTFDWGVISDQLENSGIINKKEAQRIWNAHDSAPDSDDAGKDATKVIQDILEKKGYDGIVYLNRREGLQQGWESKYADFIDSQSDDYVRSKVPEAQDSYVVFSPRQIKSAVGNQGTYDPNDPRISYKATEGITQEQLEKAVQEASPALHDLVYDKKAVPEDARLDMLDRVAYSTKNPEDALNAINQRVFGKFKPDMNKIRRTFIEASAPLVGKERAAEALAELEKDIKIEHAEIQKKPSKLPSGELLARNLVQSSDGALRFVQDVYKSKTIGTIRNYFFHDAGEAKSIAPTYFESIDDYVKPRLNAIAKAVKGMNQKDLAQIVDILQHPDKVYSHSKQVKEASLAIGNLIKENRDYLTKAGIDVGEVQGYFPRIYDIPKILNDTEGFEKVAEKAYGATYPEATPAETTEMANQWLYNILQQDQLGTTDSKQDFQMFGSAQPKPSHLKERVLSKEADDILQDYLVRNPVDAMVPFLTRSAKKAEFNRRFNPEQWTELKKKMRAEGVDEDGIHEVMDVIIRNTGMNSSQRSRVNDAFGGLKYLSNLIFLPKSLLPSLPEAFTIGARSGDFGVALRSLGDSYRAALKTKGAQSMRDAAEMEGLIGDIANDMTMAQRTGGYSESERLNNLNRKFFKTILLDRITSGQIAAVNKSAKYVMSKWADSVLTGNKHKGASEFMLKELGIAPEKMKEFAEWVAGSGGKDIASESVMDNSEMATMYRLAKRRFVNDVIQEPTAATRQRYANTPFGQFAYGLTSFINSYSKRVLLRSADVFNEAGATLPSIPYKGLKAGLNVARGNFSGAKENINSIIPAFKENIGKGYTPADRLMMASQTMMLLPLLALGAGVRELRDWADKDEDAKPRSTADRIMTDVSASSMFGSYDSPINMLMGLRYQRDPLTMFSGPLPALGATALKTLGSYALNNTDKTNTAERSIAKQVYSLGVAPMLTSLITTNVPYARIGYPAIQAITSKRAKSAVTNLIAGKKRNP